MPTPTLTTPTGPRTVASGPNGTTFTLKTSAYERRRVYADHAAGMTLRRIAHKHGLTVTRVMVLLEAEQSYLELQIARAQDAAEYEAFVNGNGQQLTDKERTRVRNGHAIPNRPVREAVEAYIAAHGVDDDGKPLLSMTELAEGRLGFGFSQMKRFLGMTVTSASKKPLRRGKGDAVPVIAGQETYWGTGEPILGVDFQPLMPTATDTYRRYLSPGRVPVDLHELADLEGDELEQRLQDLVCDPSGDGTGRIIAPGSHVLLTVGTNARVCNIPRLPQIIDVAHAAKIAVELNVDPVSFGLR